MNQMREVVVGLAVRSLPEASTLLSSPSTTRPRYRPPNTHCGATFEPDGAGTRVTQEFETVGRISAISSWLFSRGSYEGSFRGELEKFGRIAEREARQ
jgi:hypothetical protein